VNGECWIVGVGVGVDDGGGSGGVHESI